MLYICKKSALPKILIIRLSSIGDIVLTTPVVRCIKMQVPGAEVHFAIKKAFLPVVSASPYIDKIHLFDGSLKSFTQELKAEKFDFIVDLHQSLRSRYIRQKLGTPTLGFPKLNFQKWLLVWFKINLLPDTHIVDRYFMAAAPLKVKNDGKGLDYFIPEDEVYDIAQLPVSHREGFAAFAIGAKHATKRLPAHKIVTLCLQLDIPVVLLGDREDAVIGSAIAEACGPAVHSLCGELTLNQSASVVQQARYLITHDTGLMHIAAAFRKKIISVWGNTVPAFGMFPYMPGDEDRSVIIEKHGLKCRPCSKLGHQKCPRGHFKCMEELDMPWVAMHAKL